MGDGVAATKVKSLTTFIYGLTALPPCTYIPLIIDIAVTLQIDAADATTALPLILPNSIMSTIEHFCPVTE